MSKKKLKNVISVFSSVAVIAANAVGLTANAAKMEGGFQSNSRIDEAAMEVLGCHSHSADSVCDCELNGTGNGATIALIDAGVTKFDTYKHISFVDDETIGSDHGDEMMEILNATVPDAKILDVRVLDDEGKGKYSDVSDGIKWAVDNNADIIVMSFAGESNSSLLWDAVEYAEKNNVFVVASAGNTYEEKEMFPAAFNNVISVGAINENGLITDCSNFGEYVDTYSECSDGTSGAAQFVAAEAAVTIENLKDISSAKLKEQFQLNEKTAVTRTNEENADELVYASKKCIIHTYKWVTTKNATCTTTGSKSYKCSKCGYVSKTQSIAKLGHSFDSWKTTKAATCTETGTKIRTCKRSGCTYQETQTIPKASHTYSWVTTQEPTCTAAGSKSNTCTKCGYVSNTQSIAKLGHDFDNWSVTQLPTDTTEGVLSRSCKRSDCNCQEAIAIIPANYDTFGSQAYFDNLKERTTAQASSYKNESDYDEIFDGIKAENMMSDFEVYSNYVNMNDIPDDRWEAFCQDYVSCVLNYGGLLGGITQEMHYFRNNLNRAPETLDALLAEKDEWDLLGISDSLYHMYNTDGEYNVKFISKDGYYEAVYNKDGVLLTQYNDSDNMGTFNYSSPNDNKIKHATFDVITYYKWGNVDGGEIPSALGDPVDALARYALNGDAQAYRATVEALYNN